MLAYTTVWVYSSSSETKAKFGDSMEPDDEMSMMCKELDEKGRKYVLAVLRSEMRRIRRSSRPRLRLVTCAEVAPSLHKGQVNSLPIVGAG